MKKISRSILPIFLCILVVLFTTACGQVTQHVAWLKMTRDAELAEKRGNMEEAEHDWELALEMAEEVSANKSLPASVREGALAMTLEKFGMFCVRDCNFSQAEKLLLRSEALSYELDESKNTHFADSLHNLVQLYRAEGKKGKAKIIEKRELAARQGAGSEANWKNMPFWADVKYGNYMTDQGNYQAAIKCYDKALAANPGASAVYSNRAVVYLKLKQFQMALNDCEKAISLDPKSPYGYIARAKVCIAQQHYNQALDDCNKALELDPNLALAYKIRGNALIGLGQYRAAIEDCNIDIELDPKDGQTYYDRARAYEKMRKNSFAADDYAKSKALGYKPSM